MTKYTFKCKECNDFNSFKMKVSDFIKLQNTIKCDKCQENMSRVYKNFNFKVNRSSREILESIVSEKQDIIDKFNSGDIKTITDICGE